MYEYDLMNHLDLSIGRTLLRVFSKTMYKLNLYIIIWSSVDRDYLL
jgi:hypothetical protein